LITITNDAYINAESVCALLEKITNLYVGIPISIFLDNARYQKCALVREKAKSLNIELWVALHLNVETFDQRKNRPLIYANWREFGLLFAKIRLDWRTKYKPHLSGVLPNCAFCRPIRPISI